MFIENLTTYDLLLIGDLDDEHDLVEVKKGSWVKFEEAKGASLNDLQQLKAKISEIRDELKNCRFTKMDVVSGAVVNSAILELQKLSAV